MASLAEATPADVARVATKKRGAEICIVVCMDWEEKCGTIDLLSLDFHSGLALAGIVSRSKNGIAVFREQKYWRDSIDWKRQKREPQLPAITDAQREAETSKVRHCFHNDATDDLDLRESSMHFC